MVTLVSPSHEQIRSEVGAGPYEVLGRFQDKGYSFGPVVTKELAEWAQNRVPAKATLIGYAVIKTTPWV